MSVRELWRRILFPLRKARLERDLRDEMNLHVSLRAEQLARTGMSDADAVGAARRRFGNHSRIAAASRDVWGWHWVDGAGQDTRYILRQLRRSPGFALVVCVTIALGIAINAAAFSFYDAIVLKPLPVRDPARIVRITQEGRAFGFELLPFSAYDVARRDARTLQAATATTPPESFVAVLPGHAADDSRSVGARFVTPDFARTLGVAARIGRWFDAEETGVVLDHAFWTRELNADPSVIGRSIRVNGLSLPILGVAPEKFAGTGMPAVAPDLWLPLAAVTPLVGADWRNDGRAHWEVLARLAPAASLPAAAAELSSLSRSIADSVGKPIPIAVRAATFFQADAGEFAVLQQASVAFMVALALMLCIAAVNLVNLFAARNAARASEVTVRLALGANRGRIARQLVSESVLLSLAGGALGLLGSRVLTDWIERWIVATIAAISGGFTAVTLDLSIDWRIALYTAALTLVIGVVVGVWPAQIAARGDMNALLRRGGTSTADAGTWAKRNTLLAVQIASCIILLTAAGMLLGGVRRSHTIDPHFDTAHLLVVTVHDDAPFPQRAERRAEIQRRLAALPGVRAVSWTLRAPFNGTHLRRVGTARGSVTISLDNVDESYFDAIGLSLLRGRAFTRREIEDSAGVMIISESMARVRWPGGDAVGRSLRPGDPLGGPDTTKPYTVIGVVPDIRSQFLSRANGPSAYFPYDMNKPLGSFLVRTRGEPELLENEVRAAIGLVSPILVARTFVVTMQAGPMALQRLMAEAPATVALLIAVLGLGLASVGVFGVISQIVVRRTREIGIHVALGARGRDVVWMVALKTLRPVMWGTAFGAVAALGLSLFLRSLIAMPDVPDLTLGAGAFNPAVFVGVAGVLAVVIVAALGVPAWRAVRIDPVRALASD